ncbi:hypothetical protein L2E82_16276 [Cichorium intybus]|uniref:Uncharacterized protein n=1 Tax=Cichorium intybus TaxID=13427 RepID=A0ACB9F4M3_CICIN|nr:hypothetical protein L2E82_16276 [Cichorium intybus]
MELEDCGDVDGVVVVKLNNAAVELKNRRGVAEVDVRREEGVAVVVEVEESERMKGVGDGDNRSRSDEGKKRKSSKPPPEPKPKSRPDPMPKMDSKDGTVPGSGHSSI